MIILAGGPSRDVSSDIFKAHKEGLLAQATDEIKLEIRHKELRDTGGPKWTGAKMEAVGRARQGFIEEAGTLVDLGRVGLRGEYPRKYDGLFLVDDDLILGPGVLERMLAVKADVVYGVFLSDWPGLERRPQVWDISPYGHTSEVDMALAGGHGILTSDWGFEMLTGEPRETEVFGGGACTLIRGRGLESHYHPILESLKRRGSNDMWAGEDRTFCLGLEARGVKQVAVTGLPILHLDKPSKQTKEAIVEAKAMVGLA